MKNKNKACKAVSMLLISGMLISVPTICSEAAVITSNATDKIAVVFNENTAYSAGDYIIYDGEMYICTEDIQGAWGTAENHFMQITKNHELGSAEDLSASYDVSADPSEEKSLMAFAANVWQKLKGFLGMDNKDAGTDANHYKNASVSAKLNYLEQQNQSLNQNITNLQNGVNQSFQSVSNGKSLIAGAITDKGGTAGSRDTFQQFSQSIRDLAQLQYNKGYDTGHSDGTKSGYESGYGAGIEFADGRVNESSASYQQGASASNPKVWTTNIRVRIDGPDKEPECFTSIYDADGYHVTWEYTKKFEGHKILSIYAEERAYSSYGGSNVQVLVARIGDNYEWMSSDGSARLGFSENGIYWGEMSYNKINADAYKDLKFIVYYI